MNDTPTSGPMTIRSTHHAREASSSRHSLSSSQMKGGLRERKEELLERRRRRQRGRRGSALREIRDGAFAADAAAAQQDEAIAHARGVADLMNRQEQRASAGRVLAQRGA